ncbi:MAG: glycosyltransferase family 39 protein [Thermodesulfobacteriota bacterium]
MASMSWLKWSDILIDFGREVYVPWQLAEGKVLYRDIFYFNGPLSPYLNSLLFRLFGESIFVLEAFNILVIAATTFLIYKLFKEEGDGLSTLFVCAAFLTLFAFPQYMPYGNYNFVAPYSHELTHGIFISLLGLYLLRLYVEERRYLWLASMGFCAGLALLTKVEVYFSFLTAVVLGLFLAFRAERPGWSGILKRVSIFGFAAILPVAAFLAYLSLHMEVREALRGIFGSWFILGTTDVGSTLFYRVIMGVERPWFNLGRMLTVFSWYAAWFVVVAVVNHAFGKTGFLRKHAGLVACLVSVLVFFRFHEWVPWPEIFRPLPLIMLLFGAAIFVLFVRSRNGHEAPGRSIPVLALTVFSFMMLLKILLAVHIVHYGFALAMPATLVFIKALLSWAPSLLTRLSGHCSFYRMAVLTTIMLTVGWHAGVSWGFYKLRSFAVGSGWDTVVTYGPGVTSRGLHLKAALEEIEKIMAPRESFVALPEGVILNYLSRRPNPTGFVNFLPPDVIMFGEERMLAVFEEAPPDYVLLVSRPTPEYGYEFFGRDYGLKLYSWATDNYEPVSQIGAAPFQGDDFGVVIMKRVDG